jgi:uncharacterized protein
MTTASEVIQHLGLVAHPEGGWYAETWRSASIDGGRPSGSAILYLLTSDERSHWHRVDADEIWQHAAGDPLELRAWSDDFGSAIVHRLGGILTEDHVVQAVIPAGTWQSARTLGAWTLVGCIVTPAFEFDGFELAEPGWEPPV